MRDGFGAMAGAELPTSVRLGIGAVAGAILCALGYRAAKANDAKELARGVIMVVAVLVISFLVVEVVKNLMARPRPWLVFEGYEGIVFTPWYSQTSGAGELIATLGLDKSVFNSFPCSVGEEGC